MAMFHMVFDNWAWKVMHEKSKHRISYVCTSALDLLPLIFSCGIPFIFTKNHVWKMAVFHMDFGTWVWKVMKIKKQAQNTLCSAST